MAERRRLFFALWPDAEVRAGLRKIQRRLGDHCGRATHPEDFHITLNFLGPVTPDRLPCIESAAARVHGEPFELVLDRTVLWTRSRILWCGPSQTPAPLAALFSDLGTALKGCGFEPETRPFKPHVTLARDARVVPTGPVEPALAWACDRFVLVESLSVRDPPRYRVMEQWTLAEA